jgi:hypothetical protein
LLEFFKHFLLWFADPLVSNATDAPFSAKTTQICPFFGLFTSLP